MSLLAILISLALEKLLPGKEELRSLAWFESFQLWIRSRLADREKWQGIPSLLIIVLLPVSGIAVIQHFLNDLLPLFSFLFGIVVLIYCLGPDDEHRLVHDYLDAMDNDDTESATNNLKKVLSTRALQQPSDDTDDSADPRTLIETILIVTHDRMLAVLFWFVVLGPIGAALYRLTLALQEYEQQRQLEFVTENMAEGVNEDNIESAADNPENAIATDIDTQPEDLTDNLAEDAAKAQPAFDKPSDELKDDFRSAVSRLHHILGWIPSHLTALSYAVMGSFVHALQAWQNQTYELSEFSSEFSEEEVASTDSTSASPLPANHRLLTHIGMASLQFDTNPPQDNDAIRETLGLCGRSLVAWITILAIMTLAGWAS